MDDLIDVLGAMLGLSQEEIDFGFKLVAAVDDAPRRSTFDTGNYLMTLRPDHIDESTWRLIAAGLMLDATTNDISSVETTAGMTFVSYTGDGYRVAHFSVDEVPATMV